jgi:murein DD-endopeptidase MepM/ murein hydrolase activator NlpD
MSSESEMSKETSSSYNLFRIFYRNPRFMKTLSLVSSFGVLSSGLVVAQTNAPIDRGMAPPQPTVAPAPEVRARPAAPEPIIAPEASVRERTPVVVEREPIRVETAPAPVREPEPIVERRPAPAAPEFSLPEAATITKPPAALLKPEPVQETAKSPIPPTNTYIDRTDYSVGATRNYEAPDRVLLTERSTGCSTIAQNGQLQSGNCGIVTSTYPTPTEQSATQPTATGQRLVIQPTPTEQRANAVKLFEDQRPGSIVGQQMLGGVPKLPMPQVVPMPQVANNQPINLGPMQLSSINQSQGTPGSYPVYSPSPNYSTYSSSASPLPTSLAYYNLTRRPFGRLNMGKASFMFPLSIPTEITSIFGWRIHPITGDQRFHSGTDLGAPEGTPVLAAVTGQVVTADFLGGYGLTVILQHEKGTQESLYAHMSQIFVKPGDKVEQGNVIGRVGNTGNSTGPHLHFEWRHLTAEGWVAVDAGPHLQYSLAQFTRALQLAQSVPQRGR